MITVKEVSILLGGSEAWVRSLVAREKIGDCFSSGKSRKTYRIIPGQLARFMCISEHELEVRLSEVRDAEI